MKKTIIVSVILIIFYLNLFLLKSTVINFLIVFLFIFSPVLCVLSLIKSKNKKENKDEIIALSLWGIALIPTGIMIVMTIMFGLPPEGYSSMDMFR